MNLTVYSANPSGFAHEEEQLREIAKILSTDPSDKPVFMLTNVLIGSHEIDCILLTEKGPILIDTKAYQGKISGCENGNWWTESDGKIVDIGKNLFLQAKNQRFAFVERWNPIVEKHLRSQIPRYQQIFFQVWLYFKQGSFFADERFNPDFIPWLSIVTRDSLLDEYEKISNQYRIGLVSYKKILAELGLSDQESSPVSLKDEGIPEKDTSHSAEPYTDETKKSDEKTEEKEKPEQKQDTILSTRTEPAPVLIQKGTIRISLPIRLQSRSPELLAAISEASTYLELNRLDQALNLADYALSIDRFDREAQDLKYEILYRLQRGEEAESFIEEILRGEG
ncbi:MAG: NERD domain-containing protein [Methanospirillaceae archaeon]|nr:NERD domain-containing protein [Methanospirillaceae archaeon]